MATRTEDVQVARGPREPAIWRFLNALEVDTRLLGMVVALILIWIGFDLFTGGAFLTPRNLFNLAVQTSVVGVMATGMVFIIVTRNIDLSVGSVLGFVGMIAAVVQAELLPPLLGHGHPAIWLIALFSALVVGATIGAAQGLIVAYGKVPAFIVTLGGLLIYRGAAWWVTSGRTVAPLDESFQVLGGGLSGSIGATWSWLVGLVAIGLIVMTSIAARRRRQKFNFPVKPLWAELTVVGTGIALVLAFVTVMNAYDLPVRVAREILEARGVELAQGERPSIARGIPVPVLIMLGVALVMTFIATRMRFGRYVYAIGGNPEAAQLAGVPSQRMIVAVFALMGTLAAIAGCIAAARLNAGANATGQLAELSTIAAAVIGGTSLAGGAGTVAGALLGALVMQSLSSGMVLLGLDTPLQNIVIGIVLIGAVYLDSIYQSRRR
ncbi:MAG: sugar ABC transporter permease [Geminicoccaceae bacterium]